MRIFYLKEINQKSKRLGARLGGTPKKQQREFLTLSSFTAQKIFTEDTLNGKLHFLCSVFTSICQIVGSTNLSGITNKLCKYIALYLFLRLQKISNVVY